MLIGNSVLKYNYFKWNYLSQALQNIASWIYIISENYLVVRLSKSGLYLGITTALYWGPMVILGMYGGVIADRFGRRNLLLVCQAVMGVASLLISIITVLYEVNISLIWSFTLVFGVINSFHYPTMQSIPRELVPLEKLPSAVALNGSIPSIGRMIGPLTGGVVIYFSSSSFGFAISSVMFFLSAALMLPVSNTSVSVIKNSIAKSEILDGLNYVIFHKDMLRVVISMTLIYLTVYHFQVILPLVAKSLQDYTSMTYGVLMSAFGLGSFFGSIFLSSKTHKLSFYFSTSLSALAFGLVLISLANRTSYAVIYAILIGFSANIFSGASSISLHGMTSDDMRSRVMAVYSISYLGTGLIGGPIIGFLMSDLGLFKIAFAQAIVCISIALLLRVSASNRSVST